MGKTSMQHLIEKIMRMPESNIKNFLTTLGPEYLKSEKEQMEEFYNEGQDFSTYVTDEIYGGVEYWEREPLDFEQYYKEKYGKV
jgi:hypothetical protein